MKICFICGEYPPGPHGGIGTLARMLGRGLAASGHEVRVIGLCHPDYPGRDYEIDEGVQVWRYREPRVHGGWLVGRRRLFLTIARWCRAGEVDLIDLPDWQGLAAGWPALPVPVIVRLNGSETYFADEMGRSARRLTQILELATLKRADFVCSVSRYTAERTRSIFRLQSEVDALLLNPIRVPRAPHEEPRSRHDVVFSGTLTAKKGVVPLVDAWPSVRRRFGLARLHLFGRDGTAAGGSMRALLEARLPPADRETVTFHGHVDRDTLFSHLRRARAAVFPSFAEAFPLAPLEAMACGCPTIGSIRGAGREAIEPGRDGLLVEPDPESIAAALVNVLADDDLARRLGEAGQRCVETRHSLERRLAENIAFYEDCVARFRSAAGDTAAAVA